MKKQILATIAAIALLTAFLVPSMSNNSFAQVTSESRVLQAILGLTEVVKGQSQALVDTTENIEDDLLFKKKFWQFKFNVTEANVVGLIGVCPRVGSEACAFNVESIQFDNATAGPDVGVGGIIVDDAFTQTDFEFVPTNFLVDSGQGKVGALFFVGAVLPFNYTGDVEFNGEKPQDMILIRLFAGSGAKCLAPGNNNAAQGEGCGGAGGVAWSAVDDSLDGACGNEADQEACQEAEARGDLADVSTSTALSEHDCDPPNPGAGCGDG
jgi:hypothetical protein